MAYILKTSLRILILFSCFLPLHAQKEDLIQTSLQSKWLESGQSLDDIAHYKIIDQYTDGKTNITYAYLQQYYLDIPIENAIANFAIKNNEVVVGNMDRWVGNLSQKIKFNSNSLTASDAVIQSLARSGIQQYLRSKPVVKTELNQHHLVFRKIEKVREDIPAQLVYKIQQDGNLVLAWKVGIHEYNGNYWENYVNAHTGNIIDSHNSTLSCLSNHIHSAKLKKENMPVKEAIPQYKVWPVPLSGPNDGNPSLITDPSDQIASPLGWHDDGTTKYTITKGNNVHAFSDPDSNFISSNDEPNGGENLVFDYPYNPTGTIAQNKDAATVNLFYMNNVMHDLAWHYGMDEQGGSFQKLNTTGKGRGNDHVIALAQYGANNSRIRNNADFFPPADGTNGRMRMFIWNATGEKLLKIIEPITSDLETGSADFGPAISTIPIKGKIALVSDGTSNPSLGCKTLKNANEVKGKIALIDRGDCFFHEKACFAQAAGAIAVIIANFENTPNNMAGLSPAPCNVIIPIVSVGSSDAIDLRKNASNYTLSIQKPTANLALERDGSFDNGVIAHEYAHGISTRLTGGPSNSGCLNNDEQMGEGWSDFFSLIVNAKPGDTENKLIGIGTYPIQQAITDRGIRKFPYTTNMSTNGQTYEDVFSTETPHALGEVWTLILWEVYWKMTKAYGYDANLYTGQGGNNKAIKLVFEGMKLQPCSPGFADGRDAILKADMLLYNGANQCLLWEAFAKRGLGFSAKQGSSQNRGDGIEAFDLPPTCIPTVKISKSMTPLINAGEDILVTISARNDTKDSLKNVVLSDIIPDGCSLKPNSSSVPLIQAVNKLSYKHIAGLKSGETITLSYKLESSKAKHSSVFFIDSMETTELNYDLNALEGTGIWEITDVLSKSGKKSWFVPNQATDNDQVLSPLNPFDVSKLQNPVMRFYHRYGTQHAFDGGVLRVTTDGGTSYSDLGTKIFRNNYNGPLSYFAIPIPELRAFYGDSKGFIPTFIDLADYKNQKFNIQFRWGSDDAGGGTGWFVDDLEIMDMVNYNSQACIEYNETKSVCAEAPEKGTIVESKISVSNKEFKTSPLEFTVSPNPALNHIFLSLHLPQSMDLIGEIFTLDGKKIKSFRLPKSASAYNTKIETHDLSNGMYVISVHGGKFAGREKFVIQR